MSKKTGVRAEAPLAELEAALGHEFARSELLVLALTHRSLANDLATAHPASGELTGDMKADSKADSVAKGTGYNERLEFLGDAVLGLVVAEQLFAAHPEWNEGELTRVRSQLVSRKHMADSAHALGLGRYVRLSKDAARLGLRDNNSVLSNCIEAVIGALFLDGGLEPARKFVQTQVIGNAAEHLANELLTGAPLGNFKAALQQYLQARKAGSPLYRVKSESAPGPDKSFIVEVRLHPGPGQPGEALARGKGRSKKLAEQDAARRALDGLKAGTIGIGASQRGRTQGSDKEQGRG